MAASFKCGACQMGEHSGHVEHWNNPGPGILGGAMCPCKGDCTPPDLSALFGPAVTASQQPDAEHAPLTSPAAGGSGSTGHDKAERGRHHRNAHLLELDGCTWRCLICRHQFDAAVDANLFACGDDCTGKHPGDDRTEAP